MRRLIIVVLLIGMLASIVYLFVWSPESWRLYRQAFDAEIWKSSPATWDEDSPRLMMVDDLLATGRLIGQSRESAVQMLGPADDTPYFRDYDLVYWLGPERGFFSIDSEWLIIKLDEEGVIRDASLARD
ncbi:MAG: hypothetical protein AAF085_11685 [Planctomycetota bacterium]